MGLTAIDLAIKIIDALQALAKLGADTLPLYTAGKAQMELLRSENRDPTQAEWDNVNGQIDAELKKLDDAG